jgi:hypothetical protein
MAGEIPGQRPEEVIKRISGIDFLDSDSSDRFDVEMRDTPLGIFSLGDLRTLIYADRFPLVLKEKADLVRQRVAEFNARQDGQISLAGNSSSEAGK